MLNFFVWYFVIGVAIVTITHFYDMAGNENSSVKVTDYMSLLALWPIVVILFIVITVIAKEVDKK